MPSPPSIFQLLTAFLSAITSLVLFSIWNKDRGEKGWLWLLAALLVWVLASSLNIGWWITMCPEAALPGLLRSPCTDSDMNALLLVRRCGEYLRSFQDCPNYQPGFAQGMVTQLENLSLSCSQCTAAQPGWLLWLRGVLSGGNSIFFLIAASTLHDGGLLSRLLQKRAAAWLIGLTFITLAVFTALLIFLPGLLIPSDETSTDTLLRVSVFYSFITTFFFGLPMARSLWVRRMRSVGLVWATGLIAVSVYEYAHLSKDVFYGTTAPLGVASVALLSKIIICIGIVCHAVTWLQVQLGQVPSIATPGNVHISPPPIPPSVLAPSGVMTSADPGPNDGMDVPKENEDHLTDQKVLPANSDESTTEGVREDVVHPHEALFMVLFGNERVDEGWTNCAQRFLEVRQELRSAIGDRKCSLNVDLMRTLVSREYGMDRAAYLERIQEIHRKVCPRWQKPPQRQTVVGRWLADDKTSNHRNTLFGSESEHLVTIAFMVAALADRPSLEELLLFK